MTDASERFDRLLETRSQPRTPISQKGRDNTEAFLIFCESYAHVSAAQLFQDLFVLFATRGKRNGFFVEFGATDGVRLSNSVVLENMGWNGILAEPARHWHKDLRANRKAAIDFRCVWSRTGDRLEFIETEEKELSTVNRFVDSDFQRHDRENVTSAYEVETVSLDDLLTAHSSPKRIDYLSIDTEGSELEILSQFDFKKWDIGIITVEHNFTDNREKIRHLLSRNGFFHAFGELTKWDDWYLNEAIFPR